jgi:hypothetical protein
MVKKTRIHQRMVIRKTLTYNSFHNSWQVDAVKQRLTQNFHTARRYKQGWIHGAERNVYIYL